MVSPFLLSMLSTLQLACIDFERTFLSLQEARAKNEGENPIVLVNFGKAGTLIHKIGRALANDHFEKDDKVCVVAMATKLYYIFHNYKEITELMHEIIEVQAPQFAVSDLIIGSHSPEI
jgi:hypothetical protein